VTEGAAEPPRTPLTRPRPLKQEQEPASTEITEVGPGVLRMQVPIFFTGLGHVNCYALTDHRGAAVVDAGMPGRATWQALTRRLSSAGLKVRDVHTVLVTHSHPDHFGSAGRLAHEAGADLVTEGRFHTWLEPRPTEDDHTGYFSMSSRTPWGGSAIPHLRRSLWTMRLARRHLLPFVRPPIPTRRVHDGDHIELAGREWEVLYTPGHTGDHVCLFDPEAKLLLSGDHVLPTITPHVPGLSPLADPLGSYLESLQGLRRLGDVSLVLPAHGHPFSDLAGRIDQIVAHHEGRLAELQRISAALGPATVVELSRELFRPAMWGMMAESETYAHLEYLRLRGKAEGLELDGRVGYILEGAESAPPVTTGSTSEPPPPAGQPG
jgi:glyoxylase-like metal-dependent hydrolase (beta-lactamase superfamily II)